jgi:2-polyprenyl-6-methoxyphenol hydroxylase-like FAD-dependent oxidoreductase
MDADALVIGGGPAGTASAILLARAGWSVLLAERHAYPRAKVCGECVAPGNLALLDALGVGGAFRRSAGPELRRTGWLGGETVVSGALPACASAADAYGRALGRDRLDALLIDAARDAGVTVLQPARVRSLSRAGEAAFDARVDDACGVETVRARVVVAAHGSWEAGPSLDGDALGIRRTSACAGDLFAFKATYVGARVAPGWLPVLAFPGGYGGAVLGDAGRTTLACCIRRDALSECRRAAPGLRAGPAVERRLRQHCPTLASAFDGAARTTDWLSVGPIRPGERVGHAPRGVFLVGNAAGESHPLIGEGIGMALQSAALLTTALRGIRPCDLDAAARATVQREYARRWRRTFRPRLAVAALYAHAAMHPELAAPCGRLLQRWPVLLTHAARLAGKARPSVPIPDREVYA